MPRVRLTQVSARGPADHPVEEPRLLEVGRPAAEPAFHLAQEVCFHTALGPVEVLVEAGKREVVPVGHTLHVPPRA
eukprot:14107621-Alexandrium_andersonii.AAC.1